MESDWPPTTVRDIVCSPAVAQGVLWSADVPSNVPDELYRPAMFVAVSPDPAVTMIRLTLATVIADLTFTRARMMFPMPGGCWPLPIQGSKFHARYPASAAVNDGSALSS